MSGPAKAEKKQDAAAPGTARKGWKPGQSGNPRGRKPGTGRMTALRQQMADSLPGILEMLTQAAKAGDVQAIRLLLDRTIAPLRPLEAMVTLRLPDGSLADQARAVVASVAAGGLSPGQGAQLVAAIASMGRLVDIEDLAERLEKLEAANAPTP